MAIASGDRACASASSSSTSTARSSTPGPSSSRRCNTRSRRCSAARSRPTSSLLTIGGQGIVAQMTAIDAENADELLEAYKVHNDGLHDTLEAFDELLELLPLLRAEGRQLGLVTAKRHRTVALALDRFPALASAFDVVVAHEDTERHKPDPDPVLFALEKLGGVAGRGGLRRRFTVRHRRGEGCRGVRDRGRLGGHPSRRAPAGGGAGRLRAHARGARGCPLAGSDPGG